MKIAEKILNIIESGEPKLEILFDEKDFNMFMNDYKEEFDGLGVKVESEPALSPYGHKIRVILSGGKPKYLFTHSLANDIEKNYGGAIA